MDRRDFLKSSALWSATAAMQGPAGDGLASVNKNQGVASDGETTLRTSGLIRFCLLLCFFLCSSQVEGATGVRILFGLADSTPAVWDGSVTATGAEITSIEPWRFDVGDVVLGKNSWRASTHAMQTGLPAQILIGRDQTSPPVVANGVLVWLRNESENTELEVTTTQGSFAVRLRDIPWGRNQQALAGRVLADRIPPVDRLTSTPDEQDYPAAAVGKNGDTWLAYLEFRHNKEHDRLRADVTEAPADFSRWKAPAGGDQIIVRRFSRGAWGTPIPVSQAGGDLYRPAIAIDGSGRPWVFWSANSHGNFDLWACAIENDKTAGALRLSSAPGSDIDPVAATDTRGVVWVAWQGWRDGKASIFAAHQRGDRFVESLPLSSTAGNAWNPAIAADRNGRVTVAWDSYRNGNYDVFARTAAGTGNWGQEFPIAATARYEAYPSLAYDSKGTLWAAYEEGAELWGKDWGAYDTHGVSLYQGRAVRLIGIDRGGQRITTNADIDTVLPGIADYRVDSPARQSDSLKWLLPEPRNASARPPNWHPPIQEGPKNSLPRLRIDDSDRLWLAFRSEHPIWWTSPGAVWMEYLSSYDDSGWISPILLARTDNILDNRPAVVSPAAGELLVIGSSDSRRHILPSGVPPLPPKGYPKIPGVPPDTYNNDPYNNDLFAHWVTMPRGKGYIASKAAAPAVAGAMPAVSGEPSAIAKMRSFRAQNRYGTLRIVRGEFHRHSELSYDGFGDGSLWDQWRYVMDTAALDWVGCCDHENGDGREYPWWNIQKLSDVFNAPGRFASMFSYERSVNYPDGHRNVLLAQRGIRPLPRLAGPRQTDSQHSPDTLMLYDYLRAFNGIVASHTSATNMGTDWRDSDPIVEPVVEIYQGGRQSYEQPGAPRSNSATDSISNWRPEGFVIEALAKGYKLGFVASSDHWSTHISYCNIYVTDVGRDAVLRALKQRHVYAATDNILAYVSSGGHMMGDAFSTDALPYLRVKLTGTAPLAKVDIIKNNRTVYSAEPKTREVEFTWKDPNPTVGKESYYYVRGEQEDGNIVWVSPMWITYRGK